MFVRASNQRISIHSLRVEGDADSTDIHKDFNISIHSLRVEGDPGLSVLRGHNQRFQSTPSVWRETAVSSTHGAGRHNFNPLPPCGGRPLRITQRGGSGFISIHSLRVEGDRRILTMQAEGAISIHSLRVEGDLRRPPDFAPPCISIHSLRVEGDDLCHGIGGILIDFNPLPPCGGRRDLQRLQLCTVHFNPLPPCGGRRDAGGVSQTICTDFNPLPPCGGRHDAPI